MNDVAVKPKARVEEERSRRRRREDIGDGRLSNLTVAKKDPNYEYRWINDDPGRVHALTVRDDWDVVTHEEAGERIEKDRAVGSGIERVVDRATGKRAVLVRKPKEFYIEDRKKLAASIDDLEQSIKRGETRGQDALTGPAAYVPAGGISLSNGSKT